MWIGATQEQISSTAGYITAAIIGVGITLGAYFSRKTVAWSIKHDRRISVPSEIPNAPPRDPGPVLAELQHEIHRTVNDIKETRNATREIERKVEALQLGFAEHKGAHEGMLRDLERLMVKMFNGDKVK